MGHQFLEAFTNISPFQVPDASFPKQIQWLSFRCLEHRLLRRKRKGRHGFRNVHANPMENLTQLAGSFHAAMTAIANNHSGLPVPFMEQVVDGILDHGRISPIVLRQDKDERGVFLDLQAPGAGMRLAVLGTTVDLRGNVRLVEEREVPCSQVDQVEAG